MAATEKPVTVLTDHANLTFWKNLWKVNCRVACWFTTLQDYNLKIKHVPRKLHAATDMLSRPPNADKGEEDNQNLTLLPPELFICLTIDPPEEWLKMERNIQEAQKRFAPLISKWKLKYHLRLLKSTTIPKLKLWHAQNRMVVPPEERVKKQIAYYFHDQPATGHAGRDGLIR